MLLRRLYGLTNTEAQVALCIVRGADLKQISDELLVSLPTVRTHLQHVFDKTDTHPPSRTRPTPAHPQFLKSTQTATDAPGRQTRFPERCA